jgi:hypothetical protein
VLATFSLFSVALLLRIFIVVAVCIVWSVISCHVCDVLAMRCCVARWDFDQSSDSFLDCFIVRRIPRSLSGMNCR